MRWTFDVNCRALYMRLNEDAIDRQVEMPDGAIVDVGRDDRIVGVEVIEPSPRSVDLESLSSTFGLDEQARRMIMDALHTFDCLRVDVGLPIAAHSATTQANVQPAPEFANA